MASTEARIGVAQMDDQFHPVTASNDLVVFTCNPRQNVVIGVGSDGIIQSTASNYIQVGSNATTIGNELIVKGKCTFSNASIDASAIIGGVSSSTSSVDDSNTLTISNTINTSILKDQVVTSPTADWAFTTLAQAQFTPRTTKVDGSGNVYITGQYESSSDLVLATGIILPANADGGCLTIKYNSSGVIQWVRNINCNSFGNDISIDGSNNIYITGRYTSPTSQVSLATNVVLPISTVQNCFIIKYNSNGDALWAKTISTSNYSEGKAIAVDSNGFIHVTGTYQTSTAITVDTNVILPLSPSYLSVFVLKFDSNGTAIWKQTINHNSHVYVNGLALDSVGNVHITGRYNVSSIATTGTVLQTLASGSTTYGCFTVKYNGTDGSFVWSQVINSTHSTSAIDEGLGIAVDSSNNVYVTGQCTQSTTATIPLGSSGISIPIGTSSTNRIPFIARYNSSGIAQWVQTISSSQTGGTTGAITVNSDGSSVYVLGSYISSGSQPLGAFTLPPNGISLSGFVLKMSSSDGSYQAVKSVSGSGDVYGYGIALDTTGTNLYISAAFLGLGALTVGSLSLSAYNGAVTSLFVKYTTSTMTETMATGLTGGTSTCISSACDSEANVYVTGQYTSYFDIQLSPTITLPATSVSSCYIIKYNLDGVVMWAKVINGCTGRTIYVDTSDNVYITGTYSSSTSAITLATNVVLPISTVSNCFIIKYNSNGGAQWAKTISATVYSEGKAIVVDANGFIHVTGTYRTSTAITVNTNVILPISTSYPNVFVLKLDSNGTAIWKQTINHSSNVYVNGIALDSVGNVHITGRYTVSSIATEGTILQTLASGSSSYGCFTVKYNGTDGSVAWSQIINSTHSTSAIDEGLGIAVDSSNNVYVTGKYASSTTSTIPLGSSGLSLPIGTATDSAFIVKYDSTGIAQWYRTYDGTGGDSGQSITIDKNDYIYVTGNYTSTAAITGAQTLPVTTSQAIFIVKYDTSGTPTWSKVIDASGFDESSNVTIDYLGNVYIAGFYNGTQTINGVKLPDIFRITNMSLLIRFNQIQPYTLNAIGTANGFVKTIINQSGYPAMIKIQSIVNPKPTTNILRSKATKNLTFYTDTYYDYGESPTLSGTTTCGNIDVSGTIFGNNIICTEGDVICKNLTASGTITGDGSSLTLLNASGISSGTLSNTCLPTTSVVVGSYGSASNIPTFTVDNKGRLTYASNNAISIDASTIASGILPTNRGGTGTSSTTGTGALVLSNAPTFTGTVNCANLTASGTITGDGSSLTSLNASGISSGTLSNTCLPTTSVVVGSYGSASNIPTFTVDNKGRLTYASNNAISIDASAIASGMLPTNRGGTGTSSTTGTGALVLSNAPTFTGTVNCANLTASGTISGNGSNLTSLNASSISSGTLSSTYFPASGVVAGSYGSASLVPVFTVNNKGIITSATTNAVTTPSDISCSTLSFSSGISVGGTNVINSTKDASFNSISINGTSIISASGSGYVNIANMNSISMISNGGLSQTLSSATYFNAGASALIATTSLSYQYSLYAPYWILGLAFAAHSDARIKTNVEKITSNKLHDLRPVSYTYVDTVDNTPNEQYGFIAQEVEAVLPSLVSKSTQVVPDIYCASVSVIEGHIIETSKVHNLKVGDIVCIVYKSTNNKHNFTVKEIIDDVTFALEAGSLPDTETEVFVYGKQVDDFRSINYTNIIPLLVQEVQDQSQLLEELKHQNHALQSRLAAIEAHLRIS